MKKQFQLLFNMQFEATRKYNCFPIQSANIKTDRNFGAGGAWGTVSSAAVRTVGLVSLEDARRCYQRP